MNHLFVGTYVTHDFSGGIGEVTATREDSLGYNYHVNWYSENGHDWYKIDVLKEIDQYKDDCVFCKKLRERSVKIFPGNVAYFTPLNPVIEGHLLFIPAFHVTDFTELPNVTGRVMKAAAQYARHAGGEWDWNVITSKGSLATQTVFHLHVHLVPRVAGDGLHLPWTGQAK